MGIVIDLQAEALSDKADVLNVLRKAYLVARKLKLKDFEEWINHEMNGYGLNDAIPRYRIYHGEVTAFNPYRGWIPVIFNTETEYSIHEAREPIASIIDTYHHSNGFAVVSFSDSTNTYLSQFAPFSTKFQLRISPNLLYATFESVRNSILDWAITLEENGIYGEGLQFTDSEVKIASETPAIYYFTNNFFGDVSNTQFQQETDHSEQTMG